MIVGFTNTGGVVSSDVVAMLKGVKGFALDVVSVRVSNKGLYMQGMDQSHVCLFEYKISSDDVSRFEFTEGKDAACISVAANAIDKVLHCYREDQSITLATKGIDPTSLTITFEGGAYPSVNIDLPLHNVDGDELLTVPSVEFDVDVIVTSSMLGRIIDQLALFSDRVNVNCGELGMVWKASGDTGSVSVDMNEDNALLEYAVVEDADVKQTYNLRFLKLASGLHSLRKEVSLGLSSEHPFSMLYKLTEGDTGSSAAFYVAPCIDG